MVKKIKKDKKMYCVFMIRKSETKNWERCENEKKSEEEDEKEYDEQCM